MTVVPMLLELAGIALVLFGLTRWVTGPAPSAAASTGTRGPVARPRAARHAEPDVASVSAALADGGLGPYDVTLVMIHAGRRELTPVLLDAMIRRFGAATTAVAVVAELPMADLAAALMRDKTPDVAELGVFACANGLSPHLCDGLLRRTAD